MINEDEKNFIAEEIGNHKIDWDKIEHDNQDEGRILSEIFYEIQEKYGYDTNDIFLVCVDKVFDEPLHLMNVLDSDITEDMLEYLRSIRKNGNESTLDDFTV